MGVPQNDGWLQLVTMDNSIQVDGLGVSMGTPILGNLHMEPCEAAASRIPCNTTKVAIT